MFGFKIIEKDGREYIQINCLFFKINIGKKIKNCIAIIDPGGIGDYILHRQYFKYFKQSPNFKNKKLIFTGRKMYNNMVKNFDKDIFYDVLSYDETEEQKFKKELSRYQFDSLIHLQAMCNAIAYSHAKSMRMDFIKKIKIKNKITHIIKNKYYDDKSDKYIKGIYNKLIFTDEEIFETKRLKVFYEKLLGIEIPEEIPEITPIIDFEKKYICVSLASVGENRNYDNDKWVTVLNYIINNTDKNMQIAILGSKREEDTINYIISHTKKSKKIINLSTLTNVALLPSIIKGAKFLLSIETGTVHIAHALGCKAICLSSGGFYGRFLPYDKNVEYIFPDGFDEILKSGNQDLISNFYDYERTFRTSDIRPEKVIEVLKKYL